jgi:hypothetical protein
MAIAAANTNVEDSRKVKDASELPLELEPGVGLAVEFAVEFANAAATDDETAEEDGGNDEGEEVDEGDGQGFS